MRTSARWLTRMLVASLSASLLALHAPLALAEAKPDATTIEEVLRVLREQGILDQETHERLLAKQAVEERKAAAAPAPLGGFEWYGDLRLRHETFAFDHDALGNEGDNRYRLRYRARLGFTRKIGDRVAVGMRFASGSSGTSGDPRSTNVSFGEGNGDNFSPDGIFIDQAWADFKLVNGDRFGLGLTGGKVANPYTGKVGPDFLVFDSDLTLEGAFLAARLRPSEGSQLYATVGGFVVDEDAASKDPKLIATQLGGQVALGESMTLGGRVSAYQFRALDAQFVSAAIATGNTAGAFDEQARLGEVLAFMEMKPSDTWPIKLHATLVKNLNADGFTFTQSVPMAGTVAVPVGSEDTAWGLGFEIGSPKKLVQVGLAYYRVEANSVVGVFTDNDLFEGFTNRKGIVAYLGREIVKNVDFRLTYYDCKEIEDTRVQVGSTLVSPFLASLANAERRRLQVDVVLKF